MSGIKKWAKEHDKELLGATAIAGLAAPWMLPALGIGAGGAAAAGAASTAGAGGGLLGGGTAALFGPTEAGAGLLGLADKAASIPMLTQAPAELSALEVGLPGMAGSVGTEGASLLSQARGGLVNAVGGLDNFDAMTGFADKFGKAGKGMQAGMQISGLGQQPQPVQVQPLRLPQPGQAQPVTTFWDDEEKKRQLAMLMQQQGGYYG